MITKAHEKHTRSIAKSILYRIYSSFIVTPFVVYFISHNFVVSLTIGTAEFLVKPFTYYLFERVWAHIDYGYGHGKYDIISKLLRKNGAR